MLMKESNRVDADYTHSWYRRYRQSVSLGEDGNELIVAKPVITCKDNMLNMRTSLIYGDEEAGECGGGLFANMFS
jgi:hypothetical protein